MKVIYSINRFTFLLIKLHFLSYKNRLKNFIHIFPKNDETMVKNFNISKEIYTIGTWQGSLFKIFNIKIEVSKYAYSLSTSFSKGHDSTEQTTHTELRHVIPNYTRLCNTHRLHVNHHPNILPLDLCFFLRLFDSECFISLPKSIQK